MDTPEIGYTVPRLLSGDGGFTFLHLEEYKFGIHHLQKNLNIPILRSSQLCSGGTIWICGRYAIASPLPLTSGSLNDSDPDGDMYSFNYSLTLKRTVFYRSRLRAHFYNTSRISRGEASPSLQPYPKRLVLGCPLFDDAASGEE